MVPSSRVARFISPVLRSFLLSSHKLRTFALSYAMAALLLLPVFSAARAQQAIQVLHNHVHAEVTDKRAAFLGAMAREQQMNLTIVLPLRNQAALTALLQRLYDPTSPDYRKFLSVDQFTSQFSPTADDYQAVVNYAQSYGMKVTDTPRNRLIVSLSGSVAQVNSAFNVTMNNYQHPTENRNFFSPDREPSLNLSVPVSHISGLNNFSLPHHMLHQQSNGLASPNVLGSGPGGSYLGSDMRAAYYGGSALDGNGQVVGIFEFGGYYASDVNLSFTNAGQTFSVPIQNVLLDGATGLPSNGNDAEQTLDIVQAIGMAPGLSQVRVYIGSTSFLDDPAILNSMASENIAKQISCSWGWRPDDPAIDDPFFQEFAAQGQSFFASSGDDGAFDASVSPYFYPQEDQYVTSVGGTHLTTTAAGGAWSAETAWNSQGAGSGGGISPDGITIPSWQVGLSSTANGGSSTLRNVPDVAMEGDFDNYACSIGVCHNTYAGTSFAAPRWAAFMALINQQAVEAGTAPMGGLGFINPALYLLAQGAHASDLHDITSGNNNTASQPVWFSAVPGYDLVTGWGSANGQAFIDDMAGPQVPGFWIGATQRQIVINPGGTASTTIAVTDAGSFNGAVTFAVTSGLPSGVTASFAPNPSATGSLLTLTATSTAATALATVTITGTSGDFTASNTISVAVHAPNFTLSASPSVIGMNQGGSATSTIVVGPQYGFTGSVSLAASGLPAGVTASFSSSSTTGSSVLTLTSSSTATPGTSTVTITGTSGTITQTASIALSIQGPSFTLSNQGSVSIGQGGTAITNIYVSPQYGYTGTANLSISGLPSGVTASFSPNPTSGYSTLTLTASNSTPVGSSTITVTGTSGALSATTTFALSVYTPTFSLSAGSVNLGQGTSGTTYVYVNAAYGFTGSVALSVSGLPAGVTALFNPNPTTGASTLTLSASSTTAVGQYNLTITGTSGTQTKTATLALGVFVPTFTLSSYNGVTLGQGTTGSTYVYVTPQYGFTGSVNLSVAGLPSGVTASFSPNPTTGNSTLTLIASSTAAVGQYTATITGTSGTQTATSTLSIAVYKPTFTLSSYGSVTVGQGTSTTSSVFIYSQYGFTGSVNLSVTGLPSGVTASFSPNPTTGNSTLTLTASSTASLGQYNLTITGTSGTLTATTILNLGVYTPTFSLSSYGITMGQGTTATSSVYVSPQYGFSGSVNLAVSGLPAGVTASFSPNPTTGYSTMTLTATSTASLGQYNLTITGTSGSTTVSTVVTLGVYVPTFTISSGNIGIGQGSTGSTYVSVYSQYGFASGVNLTVTGLPAGVTASFSPNPTTYSSNLTLTASSAAQIGSSTLTITGTSGALTASTTVNLQIYAPTFTIYSGSSVTLNEGSTGTAYAYVNSSYGFAGNVNFSVTGLPSGVTGTFSPNPTTYSTALTLVVSSAAMPGTSTLTLTGTSGSITSSTPITLTINTPNFTLNGSPTHINLVPGSSATSTIAITPINAFSGTVNLSAAQLPKGVTASFSPTATSTSSILTLTADSTTAPGVATVTVTGVSGSAQASTSLLVTTTAALPATTTLLSLTAAGSAVTTVPAGTMIKAIASVSAGSTPLTQGQVNLCDASATSCDPTHLLGTAQITSAGAAVFSFIPGAGSRSYKAVFSGTNTAASSASIASNLDVTASLPSTTTLVPGGSAGNYTLTATVTGHGPLAPGGKISFLDSTTSNSVLASAPLVGGNATLSATATQSPATGISPNSVAAADFNGDGIIDLAVSNTSSGTLTILIGNGDGTFTTSPSAPSSGSYPLSVIAGDFNRDGKIDLAVANNYNNSLTILLGNGDGTFTPSATSPSAGYSPTSLALGDFNGDGLLDIAVCSSSSGGLTILLGAGDGTFPTSIPSPASGYGLAGIAVGDFNGDGKLDIAAGNSYSSSLSIYLGNGDGTFVIANTPAASTSPRTVSLGDFNKDGKLDLAVASAGVVNIFLGNGDGTFTSAPNILTGGYQTSASVADFNGDGNPDLVVANYSGNTIAFYLGNGDGTFTAGTSKSTGSNPNASLAADINGDGTPDVVTANFYSNNLSVFTSQLAQTSTATATGVSPLGNGQHAVKASFPGDVSYGASASATTQLTAQAAAPVVTLNLSSSAITAVQPLTVNVSVSGGTGNPIPTGSVILTGGGYTAATATLNAGSAVITIPAAALRLGTDALSVSYVPDTASSTIYLNATGAGSITVAAATPTVSINLSSSSITFAQPLTVTVSVSGGTGAPTASGTVTLIGAGYTSSATTLTSGSATITIPAGSLSAGSDSLTANYVPDTTGSTIYGNASGSASVTVAKVTPTVALSLSPTSITTAQVLTVTVSVNPGTGNPAPTGTVTLTSGSYSSQQTLAGGTASITIPAGSLPAGTDTLAVAYAPDTAGARFYAAASQSTQVAVSVPIGVKIPALAIIASPTSITNLQTDAISVSVSGGSGNPTPTGTVTLSSGSLSTQQTLAGGAVSFTIPAGALSAGSNTLTAAYSGDPTYAAAGTTTTVTVVPVIVSSTAPASVAAGGSTTSNVTFTPGGNYSGTMSVGCTLTASPAGAQSLPTCSLSPASVTLTAGGTGSTTFTVKTTAATTSSLTPPSKAWPWTLGGGGSVLAMVLMFGIPSRRRRNLWLMVLLLSVFGAGAVGCSSGGGGNSTPVKTTTPGTTSGSYTFTITATDSTANVTATTTVGVTVQ